MFDPRTPSGPAIWLLTGDIPTGPFHAVQVHAMLATAEITWQTLACPVGGSTWLPLVQFLDFWPSAAVSPTATTPSPAPPTLLALPAPPLHRTAPVPPPVLVAAGERESGVGPRPARPWNPTAVAWLGVLFTPVWVGVMAALNGRRLRSPIPTWLPLAVGFGSFAADVLLNLVIDVYVLDLALYLGALGLLWWFVLRHHQPLFDAVPHAPPDVTARWVWPAVAGTPCALLALFTFVVAPLLPLEPRQVCERFNAASSAREAAKYTTANLAPALEALYAQKGEGRDVPFELTDEAEAPPDVGGYLVGFRVVFTEAGQPVHLEGVYHLVSFTGAWKIEDLYVTTVNRQPLEPLVRLSTDYPDLLGQPTDPPLSSASQALVPTPSASGPTGATAAPASQPTDAKQTQGMMRAGASYAGRSVLKEGLGDGGKKLGKGVLGLLAAAAAGIASLWRRPRSGAPSGGDRVPS